MENKIINNKISVIIPVYNSEKTIIQSVDSVVRETVDFGYDWELIIVDDGSTDQSAWVIKNYIINSPFRENIQLISQKNSGAAVARNTGIKTSTGEFIAFNDSDDCWLPGKLGLQISYLLSNTDVVLVGGVFGNHYFGILKKNKNEAVITIRDQILKNYFSPPTVILRKKILRKSGLFSENMTHAEEGYFFNNVVVNGRSILLNKILTVPLTAKARYGDGGLSGNLLKMEQGELFNIKSAYQFKYISLSLFIFAYCFSIIKFFRRVILVKVRKIKR